MPGIYQKAADTYRDWKLSGVPASGAYDPPKRDIRFLFDIVQQDVAAAALAGVDPAAAAALVAPIATDARAARNEAEEARNAANTAASSATAAVASAAAVLTQSQAIQDAATAFGNVAAEIGAGTGVVVYDGGNFGVEDREDFRGGRGPNGYSSATLAQLKAAPTTDGPLMYDGKVWNFKSGNYAEGQDGQNIVKQDGTPLSSGAWVASYGADALVSLTNAASTGTIAASIASAAAKGSQRLYVPPGTSFSGQKIADVNKQGIRFYGAGKILEANSVSDLDSRRLIGSYADEMDYVIGREYLTTAINVLAAGGIALKASMFGDSTTGDFAVSNPDYVPHRLLMRAARDAGFTSVDIVNNFVNGSVTSSMNLSLIRAEDHQIYINYGMNDMGEIGDAITLYYDRLDAKLSAIRALYPYPTTTQTNGTTKDIILLLPNSGNSWQDGRAQFRFEQLRGVHAMLSRKWQVCVIDKYAFMQDSTNAKPWMDENTVSGQGNVHIHPTVLGNDKLWSLVARAVFGEFVGPNRSNTFHNLDQNEPIQASRLPNSFVRGVTLGRCGAGFPLVAVAGFIRTEYQADGLVSQTVYGYSPGGTGPAEIFTRVNTAATTWGPWSNTWTSLSPQGGWTVPDVALVRADTDGRLRGLGAMNAGTKTSGTNVFIIPAQLRPQYNDRIVLAGDTGPVRLLYTSSTGAVSLDGDTTAGVIYLSGLVGTVAGR